MREKHFGIIKADAASIWLNISSAEPNCVYSVTFLAIRKIVEAIVNLCVGREVGQKGVEVVLVGALSSVITLVIDTEVVLESWLGVGL